MMSTDKIINRDFYSRPIEEQEWLIENTWCEKCQKADIGIENHALPVLHDINSMR